MGAVEKRLQTKIDLSVRDLPLIFLLDHFEKAHGLKITIDLKRLKEKGVTAHAPITFDCTQKPLADVLRQVLASIGLDYDVDETGVLIPAAKMQNE